MILGAYQSVYMELEQLKRTKMKRFFIVIFALLFGSCVNSNDFSVSIDLGKHYRFIDDYPYEIIYNTDSSSLDSGKEIIPPVITNYCFNEKYIIAKTIGYIDKTEPIKFWIVDKDMKGTKVYPMDSVAFYRKINEMKIGLEFKNGKQVRNRWAK